MFKSIIAVIAGVVTLFILVTAQFAVTYLLSPEWFPQQLTDEPAVVPPAGLMIANLVFALPFAIAGGWVTARMAPARPMNHVYGLMAVLLVLNVVQALSYPKGTPEWYSVGVLVLRIAGSFVGGRLFVRNRESPSQETTPYF